MNVSATSNKKGKKIKENDFASQVGVGNARGGTNYLPKHLPKKSVERNNLKLKLASFTKAKYCKT